MKILFFSPYSFINVHCYPEGVVAENFRRRGHEVVQLRCKGLYAEFCISMSAIQLHPPSSAEEKAAVCATCDLRRRSLETEFGFNTFYIDDFVTDDDRRKVETHLRELTMENWARLEHAGAPIARYAAYEYILNEKIDATQFDESLWPGYLTHAKNAFLTFYAGRRLFEALRPDAVLAYNNVYSCNHIMCVLADQRDIPHYTLHSGGHHKHRLSEMTIFRGLQSPYLINRTEAWRRFRQRPLSLASVARAREHVEELMSAKSDWVYTIKSSNRSRDELKAFFGVREQQKVLLVTMASGDERFAASLIDALPPYKTPIFESQAVWIQSLIDWVKGRDDLFLIIRVHPREFPNKREAVLSKYVARLRAMLVDLPPNARVNWPDDQMSLHDIVKITDVGLNATSTAGLELLLFGVPVVIYDLDQFFSYPRELNFCATSIDEYFRRIDEAMTQGPSLDHVIGAFRWIAFKSDVVAMDISDAYGVDNAHKPDDFWSKLKRRFERWFRRRPVPAYVDPFLNRSGIDRLRCARWLAYAVEHQAESHIDAYCDELLAGRQPSAAAERAAVAAAAAEYFRKLDLVMPPDAT